MLKIILDSGERKVLPSTVKVLPSKQGRDVKSSSGHTGYRILTGPDIFQALVHPL